MRRTLLYALLSLAIALPAGSCGRPTASAGRPKLAVIIVIDQFRADYLDRFGAQFTGGFRRLLDQGRRFTECNYEQWPTVTAVGHTTVATGATPAGHGIVGNLWYDRATAKVVTSVEDPNAPLVPSGKLGASPWRIEGTTIGDELKLATRGAAKVISISLKDRSAILLGGKGADCAFWYDDATGGFESSRYYGDALPDWVEAFNASRPADKYFGQTWNLLLPESAYALSNPDEAENERPTWGSRWFPHDPSAGLGGPSPDFYTRIEESPFGNDIVAEFAKTAVEKAALGGDDVTDLLCISFSSNDLVGHAFGPYSREVQDITLRTDRVLGDLLSYLDSRVGRDQYVVAITADHGVAPNPVDSARVGGRYLDFEVPSRIVAAQLDMKFGQGPWVLNIGEGASAGLYLDHDLATQKGVDLALVEHTAASLFELQDGIAEVFAGEDLQRGLFAHGSVAERRIAASYYPGRSPDCIVTFEPFVVARSGGGTTHGTPYSYDSHVPLLFFGYGVAPAWNDEPVAVTDLAPTLASMLHVTPPSNAVGRPLAVR